MAYIRDWEPLAEACHRAQRGGLSLDEARQQICWGISDRKIGIRVVTKETDPVAHNPAKGPDVKPPPRLTPDDFDWEQSRPKAPWRTGPRGAHSMTWSWKDRPIELLELATADVTQIFGNTKRPPQVTHEKALMTSRKRGPKPVKLPRVVTEMQAFSADELNAMKMEEMAARFRASPDTCSRARIQVLSEFAGNSNSNK